MNLKSYEFPYDKKVNYNVKSDGFSSFFLMEVATDFHGIRKFEVEYLKSYKDKNWKVGKLFCIDGHISKIEANRLRKMLDNGEFPAIDEIKEEENKIKNTYKTYDFKIKNAHVIHEKFDQKGNYEKKYRINLLPMELFFVTYVNKNKKHEKIKIKIKNKNFGFPGWRKKCEQLIIEHWENEESKLICGQLPLLNAKAL